MRKPSIFTENEIRFLRELVKNHVPFMIVGLSAAALQGAPVVTQDVDLSFDNQNAKARRFNPSVRELHNQALLGRHARSSSTSAARHLPMM